MTSRSEQPKEPLEGSPVCPECGSATFWNNTDGYQTIFCINDDCKWKQQIRSRPHPAPAQPIESTKGMEHRKSRLVPDGSTSAPEREESRHTCTNLNEHDAAIARKACEDVLKEVRPEVWQFALLMEAKLRKNDHKEHWSKCNQEYLLMRLDEEVKELHSCFFIYSPGDMNFLMDGQHEDRIPGEAADVANFAMMLWDNFGEKESPRTTTPHTKQEQPR